MLDVAIIVMAFLLGCALVWVVDRLSGRPELLPADDEEQ